MNRASLEGWAKEREQVRNKALAKIEQKTADIAAQNAVIAKRIQTKLLNRLEKEIDALPELIGTEKHKIVIENEYQDSPRGKGSRLARSTNKYLDYKLRDLTAAWKDLMSDMPKAEEADDEPIDNLIARIDSESEDS